MPFSLKILQNLNSTSRHSKFYYIWIFYKLSNSSKLTKYNKILNFKLQVTVNLSHLWLELEVSWERLGGKFIFMKILSMMI